MKCKNLAMVAALATLVPTSVAFGGDSDIRIFNMRSGGGIGFYSTTRSDFVNDMVLEIDESANAFLTFAMDLTADGSTLYCIEWTNGGGFPIHTVDFATGVRTNTGMSLSGPDPSGNCLGLTIDTNDNAFIIVNELGATNLYSVDLSTGAATLIAPVTGTTLLIDFAVDTQGNCFAHDIGADTWMSLDLTTGVATTLAPTGLASNFAQGMDIDWSDDAVLATAYTGGGTGKFVRFDPNAGTTTILADTNSLNREMEMAVVPPTDAGPICPDTSTWVNNSSSSGSGNECGSDDVYFLARREAFAPNASKLLTNRSHYTVTTAGGITSLTASAECSIDNGSVTNVRGRLVVKNQAGGSDVASALVTLSTTDSVITVNITTNAGDFVGANGEVDVDLVFVQTSGGPNWNGRIDDQTVEAQ